MFCPKCGYDLPDEALFCPDCGAERPVLQELERGETSLQTEQTSGAEQALSGSEMPNTTSYKEECDTSAFIMPTGQPKHTSKKARVIGVIIGAIVGAIIAGTIGFLLMHRIVPGSVPDYYGMYSDDIGWGLVITDEKTFTGDSSKRDETYMYIYCRVDFSRTNRDASRKSHRFPQTEPASCTMPDRRSRPASAETRSRTRAEDNAYSRQSSASGVRRRSHTEQGASCGWPDPHARPPDAQGRDISS
ncbi:zinc ribbon domain-containing protein [Pseudoflavonifractor sp. HCP28S3_F10]|uniref:zinc ribbon domain-containing protein n=1 Tax=Pseudoflavonifractor sp. HCP28S3_F10 TaxID=3438947 RepID=UPI003F89C438